jgi:histidine triad (HIT) family protein
MNHCIFCDLAVGRQRSAALFESATCAGILDVRPLARGHALVIPRRHAERLGELSGTELDELFRSARRVAWALESEGLALGGVNFLVNDGRSAGQTVPHVHVHVVPRRPRDQLRVLARLVARVAPGPPDWAGLDDVAGRLRSRLG